LFEIQGEVGKSVASCRSPPVGTPLACERSCAQPRPGPTGTAVSRSHAIALVGALEPFITSI